MLAANVVLRSIPIPWPERFGAGNPSPLGGLGGTRVYTYVSRLMKLPFTYSPSSTLAEALGRPSTKFIPTK